MEDSEILRVYVEDRSETAFTEIVRRHLDLVYATALRITGERQMAQDVAQEVFLKLARHAGSVRHADVLPAWLYRVARAEALNALRAEARRRHREEEAMRIREQEIDTESAWTALRPWLDEAMARLGKEEQAAVVLRFFAGRNLAEVGQALGISEDAARKRVTRGVEKLRVFFGRHGLKASASIIGLAITTHAAEAAPPGWATTVAGTALAHAPLAGTAVPFTPLLKMLVMTKLQTATIGLLFLAGVLTPFVPKLDANSPSRAQSSPPPAGLPATQSQVQSISSGFAMVGPVAPLSGSSALGRLENWLLRMDQAKRARVPDNELRSMIWSLAKSDYPHAWRLANRVQSPALRAQCQTAVLSYWSRLDPQAALVAADSIPEEHVRREAVDRTLPAWTESDAQAAMAWVRQSVPEYRRALRMASVIQAMAKTDPHAAVAALKELPAGLTLERATLGIVEQWVAQEPSGAAGFVGPMPFSTQKSRLLFSLAAAWAKLDPAAETEWVQNLSDPRERASVLVPSVRGLVDKGNILQAAELLRRFEGDFVDNPGEVENRCLTPIISAWVQSDLPAAREWAGQLPEGAFREKVFRRLLRDWSYEEPAGAAAFAASLPEGEIQREGIKAALGRWCEKDAQAALNWTAGLPPGNTRELALMGICDGLALLRPVDAAHLAAALPAGEAQSRTAAAVVEGWAQHDPQAAATWVAAFPEGQTRGLAAKALINTWASRDAPAAGDWLQNLPEGVAREQAAQAYVSLVTEKRPDLASAWVNVFTAPPQRNDQIEKIARRWLSLDEQAARKWLLQTSLPEARKQALLGK